MREKPGDIVEVRFVRQNLPDLWIGATIIKTGYDKLYVQALKEPFPHGYKTIILAAHMKGIGWK